MVDLTADFLNSAQLLTFVRETGNYGFRLHQVVAHKASACAVCCCKTIFPLIGHTKLYNNVSKMLVVKKSKLSIVYDYRTLRHATAKNHVISKKLVHCIFIL